MYKHNEPFITSKYSIEVPTNLYYSEPCIFKMTLGSKFYIGKCQSLPQFMQGIATTIERALRTGNNDETGWYCHVIAYIKKNRVMRAKVERLNKNDVGDNTWELLKMEQEQLTSNRDNPDCLNNNFEVYIPKWIKPEQLELFKKWKHESDKRNRIKNRASNARKKHKGGQMAVRSVGRVPTRVRQKKVNKQPSKQTGQKLKQKTATGKI
jgi:hypothetical protein